MVGGVLPESRCPAPPLRSTPDPVATPCLSMMALGKLQPSGNGAIMLKARAGSQSGLVCPSSKPGASTSAVRARIGLVGIEQSGPPRPTSHLQNGTVAASHTPWPVQSLRHCAISQSGPLKCS